MVLVTKPYRSIFHYKEYEDYIIVFEPLTNKTNTINWAVTKIMEIQLGRPIRMSKNIREGAVLLLEKESGAIDLYCLIYSNIRYGRTGICMGDLSKLKILKKAIGLTHVLIPEEKKELLGDKIKIRIIKRSITTSKKYLFFEILD